ncbi:uncharacterized protein LOC117316756 isoform X2 [Pecten maximus]|uniref:uncharacterized protein LOC117316756 isoform X2 n=1 Tax=Pecten maximus TaxID=6579 RepID=UPI001458AB4B|nr:uncharacterized protein LOC117316756 isoform X2 [Pecten maximus]
MAEKASTSQADDQHYNIRILYSDMVLGISKKINPNKKSTWLDLLTALEPLLPDELNGDDITHFGQICEKLRAKGKIDRMRGSFEKLYDALLKVDVEAAEVIKETSIKIKALLSEGPPAAKRQGTERERDLNEKFAAMIDTTKSTIQTEKENNQFFPTKSLQDARQKLLENKIVIIQGNSGDGKSSTALELLRLLCCNEEEGQHKRCRQPLQLHEIKDLDSVAPKSQLAMYFDDIFGNNVVCQEDVKEWEEREKEIIAKLCGNESESNYLVITIRSGMINSLSGLGKLFTKENIVDLSQYKEEKEKLALLRLYQPKTEFVKWTDDEEKQIVASAPDIGFPQCCRLFRDTPSLQTEGVEFFERPLHYFKSSLSKLEDGKFYGLLYLFLKGGSVLEHDLDPSIENIEENEKMNAAFAFDVVKVNLTPELIHKIEKKKAEFVKESLECLLGWLVKKESTLWEKCPSYKFNHDSIEETVALLYGEKTPIGYIQNCPEEFLSYVTTTKNAPNRIVISSDNQTNAMYKRIVKELESVDPKIYWYLRKYDYLATLDVWTDTLFLQGFISWLSGQNDDKNLHQLIKCHLLNGACSAGLEDRVSYLLSVGAAPNNDTLFCVVKGGSVPLLTQLMKYDVIPTARTDRSLSSYIYDAYYINVLHEACLFEREKMVTMLCDTYPHLVHETDNSRQSTLHLVALTGNVGLFQTMERLILKSLCRVEDEQHKCETEDGRVVHRSCVCGQYMSQLVDKDGHTILHWSCMLVHRELSLELCQCYPALTTAVDNRGYNCLHFIARETPYVDMFTDCERHVKQYVEKTGGKYDITTILTNDGKSVLDLAKRWTEMEELDNSPLYDHLVEVFTK